MQNAKDTFYLTLQSRLAALNPGRTMVTRGVVRPGFLVVENELATEVVQANVFRLEWTGLQVDGEGPLPFATLSCSIRYASDGDSGNGGMNRGRLLSAMDVELTAAFGASPRSVQKMNYSAATGGQPPGPMATNISWGDPVFGASTVSGPRLERVATVNVFAYQEAGEL